MYFHVAVNRYRYIVKAHDYYTLLWYFTEYFRRNISLNNIYILNTYESLTEIDLARIDSDAHDADYCFTYCKKYLPNVMTVESFPCDYFSNQ